MMRGNILILVQLKASCNVLCSLLVSSSIVNVSVRKRDENALIIYEFNDVLIDGGKIYQAECTRTCLIFELLNDSV